MGLKEEIIESNLKTETKIVLLSNLGIKKTRKEPTRKKKLNLIERFIKWAFVEEVPEETKGGK